CSKTGISAARKCNYCGYEFLPAPVPAMPCNVPTRPNAARASRVSGRPVLGDAFDVADVLVNLVAKSLVSRDEATGRYRLWETVREYAADRLQESGNDEQEAWRVRHRDYFIEQAEAAW